MVERVTMGLIDLSHVAVSKLVSFLYRDEVAWTGVTVPELFTLWEIAVELQLLRFESVCCWPPSPSQPPLLPVSFICRNILPPSSARRSVTVGTPCPPRLSAPGAYIRLVNLDLCSYRPNRTKCIRFRMGCYSNWKQKGLGNYYEGLWSNSRKITWISSTLCTNFRTPCWGKQTKPTPLNPSLGRRTLLPPETPRGFVFWLFWILMNSNSDIFSF